MNDTLHCNGGVHPKPTISMFCALSQKDQEFWWKNYVSILKQIVWETQKISLKF